MWRNWRNFLIFMLEYIAKLYSFYILAILGCGWYDRCIMLVRICFWSLVRIWVGSSSIFCRIHSILSHHGLYSITFAPMVVPKLNLLSEETLISPSFVDFTHIGWNQRNNDEGYAAWSSWTMKEKFLATYFLMS